MFIHLLQFVKYIVYMQQRPTKQEQLPLYVAKLAQIHIKLEKMLNQQSYDTISEAQRPICSQLFYFINFCKWLGDPDFAILKKYLRQCLQIIATILYSTQLQRCTQIFPFFNYLISCFERKFCEKINAISMEAKLKRTSKNQESHLYNQFKLRQVSISEKRLLASPSFSLFILNITNNIILLQDPQCVCCSQIFYSNIQIVNKNSLFAIFTDASFKTGIDRLALQGYLNAVCNQRGGVILVGVQKKGSVIKPIGIKYQNLKDLIQDEKEISNSINMIRPNCFHLVERIFVQPDFSSEYDQFGQCIKICFRIVIFPAKITSTSYLQISVKGYQDTYEMNCFNSDQKHFKISVSVDQNNERSFYTVIHSNYYFYINKRIPQNNHKNIKCLKPKVNDQKFCNWIAKQYNKIKENKLQSTKSFIQKQQSEAGFQEEVKFKYQNTTLIVVPSKNFNRQVNKFVQELEKSKQTFQAARPYTNYFKTESARSVWMVSHEITTAQLKKALNNYIQRGIIKKGILKLMPVQKRLQIEATKLSKEKKRLIEKRLSERLKFSIQVEEVDLKNQQKQITIFYNFNSFGQAILAYMILEQAQIRGYFVRDDEKYVKKGGQNQDQ